LSGTMWSMSTSEAAVQVAPSKGETHLPDVAEQASLVTTLVPSRFRTYSLGSHVKVSSLCGLGWEETGPYRVLQEPLTVPQWGNRSRLYFPSS
jgi:hypothetical protein